MCIVIDPIAASGGRGAAQLLLLLLLMVASGGTSARDAQSMRTVDVWSVVELLDTGIDKGARRLNVGRLKANKGETPLGHNAHRINGTDSGKDLRQILRFRMWRQSGNKRRVHNSAIGLNGDLWTIRLCCCCGSSSSNTTTNTTIILFNSCGNFIDRTFLRLAGARSGRLELRRVALDARGSGL